MGAESGGGAFPGEKRIIETHGVISQKKSMFYKVKTERCSGRSIVLTRGRHS